MGSGPARSLARVERELYERIGSAETAESAESAVLVLEGRALPDERVARFVADKCRISPEKLTLLIAPTASIAGSVQVAARSVETGLHKMLELGFDVRAVRSGFGVCPLAPAAKNDLRAIGWTNDCILYGARAYFAVHADDALVASMVERLPASASRAWRNQSSSASSSAMKRSRSKLVLAPEATATSALPRAPRRSTQALAPATAQANSRLPSRSSFTTLPAIRPLKVSPIPTSNFWPGMSQLDSVIPTAWRDQVAVAT